MPISFACPSCGNKVKAPDAAAGRVLPCPKCKATLTVPGDKKESHGIIPAPTPPVVARPLLPPDPEPPPPVVAQPVAPQAVAQPLTPCPFCGELILVVAKKCRFCGEFLDPVLRAQNAPQQLQPQQPLPAPPPPATPPPQPQQVIQVVTHHHSESYSYANASATAKASVTAKPPKTRPLGCGCLIVVIILGYFIIRAIMQSH